MLAHLSHDGLQSTPLPHCIEGIFINVIWLWMGRWFACPSGNPYPRNSRCRFIKMVHTTRVLVTEFHQICWWFEVLLVTCAQPMRVIRISGHLKTPFFSTWITILSLSKGSKRKRSWIVAFSEAHPRIPSLRFRALAKPAKKTLNIASNNNQTDQSACIGHSQKWAISGNSGSMPRSFFIPSQKLARIFPWGSFPG